MPIFVWKNVGLKKKKQKYRWFLSCSSVCWAMMPFYVFTAAACNLVAVDKEEVVWVTTEACWGGPSESVGIEM